MVTGILGTLARTVKSIAPKERFIVVSNKQSTLVAFRTIVIVGLGSYRTYALWKHCLGNSGKGKQRVNAKFHLRMGLHSQENT